MNRITVQPSGPDRRVPVENQRGAYFEQGVPKEVYSTRYIARRLADGDLIEVPADTMNPVPRPAPPAPVVQKGDN